MRTFVVVKSSQPQEEDTERTNSPTYLPHDVFARGLMESPEFQNYIKQHGYHFTDALAGEVCKAMENSDGSYHIWTVDEIKQILNLKSYTNNNNCTMGDLTYLANMAYADFYPDIIGLEGCINYALLIAKDPDGYDGMVFMRWLSDVIGKEVKIKWDKF
jgi:hypothetical protein